MPTHILAPLFTAAGREAAIKTAATSRGKAFDPEVADAFLRLSKQDEFWQELEPPGVWDFVASREPQGELARIDEARLEDVVLTFADFIDLKSPFLAAHSRRVG